MRHYNTALVDSLFDTLVKLGGSELAARLVPGWRRSKLLMSPLVRHGMYYGLEAQRLLPPSAPPQPAAAAAASEGMWVAQRLGSPRPLRTRRSRADVEALLDAPTSSSSETLSRLALECGLHMTGKAASTFEAEIEREEAARLALEEAEYRALQQELRTRSEARPDATLAVLGPPTRRGSAALPGPLPAMAAALRRPATLEALEEDEDEASEAGEEGEEGEEEAEEGEEEAEEPEEPEEPAAGKGSGKRGKGRKTGLSDTEKKEKRRLYAIYSRAAVSKPGSEIEANAKAAWEAYSAQLKARKVARTV